MANTYNFTTTDTTFSLLVNGVSVGTWDKWEGKDVSFCNINISVSGTGIVLSLADPYYSALIRSSDTLEVAGVALTGTPLQKSQSLTGDVLTSSSGGTGGTGGTGSTLETSISGDTQWYKGYNDFGAVVTVNVDDNYANDSAAATGGIAIGEYYHTDGTMKRRSA